MRCARPLARVAGALVLCLSAIFPAAAQAPQREIPVELLMSAPYPGSLSAAPTGGLVAWVLNDKGVRNIWVAAPPEYRGRKLTAYTQADGQELGALTWSKDAGTLYYTRGQGPNRAGENPNPTSDPAGAEMALWRVAVAGGAPVRVGPAASLTISPDGGTLAYVRRGAIWTEPADGSKPAVQVATIRGAIGSLAWGPEGGRILFVSQRSTHAFVGILDLAEKVVHWIAPSVDTDASPVWSPDGKQVAFLRFAAKEWHMMFTPERRGEPWSVVVADAYTGKGRTVFRADTGRGSVYREIVGPQLTWAAGDRLVFPWERTGWTSLYSVPAAGGTPVLLTPGEFEVEYVTFSPDKRDVIYNSNQGDIDRRDLWRVSVSGGAPRALTTGADIEWQPVVTSDGGNIAFLKSGARRPAHAVIQVGAAAPRELAPGTIPADFPERAMVDPQPVVITSTDGLKIHAQLFLPAGAKPGDARPAAIFFHGGSRRQMLLGWNYSSYYANAYAMNQHLASKGYVVLSVNYRSGIGYGMEFREALNYGAAGGAEFQDVQAAGLYLAARPDVDPKQVVLWGGSYGGYLTAMGLSRASDLFAAGVDFHGVHDWNVGIATFWPTYNPLENPERTRVAYQASPMSTVDGWRSPVLVIHGDDDRNVRFVETVTLVQALRARGVPVEQLVFPDEIHGFLRWDRWVEAYKASAEFLDRKL
ncbi:MAG: prolyl oligopeptidase family serine peptidase, partial [Gemmatimonadota bacterium]|nr:prolyl oligopeptidase family serine peptidase [Gemmatimonadota bacterium]